MITVVNINHTREESRDLDIYVGRGSPLGNPRRITHATTREEAIEYYKGHLTKKLAEKDPEICGQMNRIWKAAKRGNINLLCYCKPQACHADFIKKLIEEKL